MCLSSHSVCVRGLRPAEVCTQYSLACWCLTGKLVGDVLLAAAFVSYAGPFNMEFRKRLVTEKWLPDLTERQIPLTSGFMPLDMLADESSKVCGADINHVCRQQVAASN